MKVREFLQQNRDKNVEIKVFQQPIKEIDGCIAMVKRYQGEIEVALNSNQNYLDFEIENWCYDDGYLVVICKANREQTLKTINAYKSGR